MSDVGTNPSTPSKHMRNTLLLGYGILKKELLILARYRVNTLSYFLSLYAIFLMIFVGGRTFGGDAFADSLEAIIVGYFLVTISHTAFNGLAYTFSREAAWGTLEQLYMARVGFRRATILMAIVRILISFVWGIAMLALMMVTTGRIISIDVVSVVPIAILAIMPIIGLGFAFGGAAILYKRVDNAFNLMQFAIFGFVAAPVESIPLLKSLPLSQGSYLLRVVMNRGYRIWEIPSAELAVLLLTAVGYLAVGFLVFEKIVELAKRRGVMGHY